MVRFSGVPDFFFNHNFQTVFGFYFTKYLMGRYLLRSSVKKFLSLYRTRSSLLCSESLTNPVQTLPLDLFKINLNNVLPSTARSSEWALSFGLCDQNIICISQPLRECYFLMYSVFTQQWLLNKTVEEFHVCFY